MNNNPTNPAGICSKIVDINLVIKWAQTIELSLTNKQTVLDLLSRQKGFRTAELRRTKSKRAPSYKHKTREKYQEMAVRYETENEILTELYKHIRLNPPLRYYYKLEWDDENVNKRYCFGPFINKPHKVKKLQKSSGEKKTTWVKDFSEDQD